MTERNHARPDHARLIAVLTAILAGLALTLAGCGGAQFERTPGSKKYRALPVGTPVKIVDDASALTQPVEDIGKLKTTIKGDDEGRDKAAEKLQKSAAKYGCDAVVGMKAEKREIKRIRKKTQLGDGGKRKIIKQEILTYEHDWTAQCIRTADAPKEVPRARRRRGKRTRTRTTTTTAPAAKPAPTKPVDKPADKPVDKPADKPAKPAQPARPKISAADAKTASEVARAFLAFSKYMTTGNVNMLCKMLDGERIYFDVRTKSPKLEIKVDLPQQSACNSLRTGDLGNYLRDFGPAEVHAEIATLIPSLFRIHGGAYLRLDPAQESGYAKKLAAMRTGKKPLACQMYSVLPAGNLFKISVKCEGVKSYRLLMRRDGPDDFKLMAMTHMR